MTLLKKDQDKIRKFLKDRHIPAGLGSEKAACSIAAINLALYGKLTDDIPECMSPVIGGWIIRIQDAMPDKLRNSDEWRNLLPLAAGTGRAKEKERLDIILTWMWETVLPQLQEIADERGFGDEWRTMLSERTPKAAADAAARAALAADAARAADAADAAARAAARAARAADAARAARAARAADAARAGADYWGKIDPIRLLKRLVGV